MNIYSDLLRHVRTRAKLSIALAVFILAVILFASLADEVREGDTLTFDKTILSSIRSTFATPTLDSFFSVATNAGSTIFIAVVSILLVACFIRYREYSRALMIAIMMGGIGIATIFLKLLFERGRPDINLRIVEESTFSFPSGHAMGSAALALTAVLLLWKTKWRWYAVAGGIVYVVFIGFSRLYLSVHYPTDVLAGWILAAIWVGMVVGTFKLHRRFYK